MCCPCDPWHITWTDLVDTCAQFSSFECSSSANALFLANFYCLVVWFVLLWWLFIDCYLYFYLQYFWTLSLNHCGKFILHQKDSTHFGTSVLTHYFFGQKRSPNNNSKNGSPALRLCGRCGSFWIRRRRSRRRSHRRCWGPACRCRNETGGAETGKNRNGRDMMVTWCGWHIDVRWWSMWHDGCVVGCIVVWWFLINVAAWAFSAAWRGNRAVWCGESQRTCPPATIATFARIFWPWQVWESEDMTRWHALPHMKRQISSVQEIGKIVWLISLQSAKSEMAGVGSNPSQAGCLCWRLVV